ncbi:hypothetical protein [Natronorubrum texcoconense]|uniref:Uncharacterized protein n=1 Tax=Natronorubrum texcoconense TaxID=1095776 RepID=A0A1G9H9B8_9EURY|nr:hypothetical protein [Natronorubrum texcoconense]SDL09033.1 hypothetical protein SAMN04515672_0139 [Natronorubrum texcoconense]
MSELAVVGAIVAVGLLGGWILSIRYHSESRQLESIARIPFNLVWILAGIFSILGGYTITGVIVLVLWSYFFFSNARRARNGDIQMNSGGWRQRAGNWNPYNRSD